jgi:hypothetical protein
MESSWSCLSNNTWSGSSTMLSTSACPIDCMELELLWHCQLLSRSASFKALSVSIFLVACYWIEHTRKERVMAFVLYLWGLNGWSNAGSFCVWIIVCLCLFAGSCFSCTCWNHILQDYIVQSVGLVLKCCKQSAKVGSRYVKNTIRNRAATNATFLQPAVHQNQPGWHQTQDDWAVS